FTGGNGGAFTQLFQAPPPPISASSTLETPIYRPAVNPSAPTAEDVPAGYGMLVGTGGPPSIPLPALTTLPGIPVMPVPAPQETAPSTNPPGEFTRMLQAQPASTPAAPSWPPVAGY